MPRLFTGFRIPEAVEDWLSGLEMDLPGARWVDPGDYHVTIRFFGDVDGAIADDLMTGLETAIVPAFEVRLKGLGCFGGNKPRTLVAEIEADAALAGLVRAHERIAQSAGLEPERRKYAPHVTLARLEHTFPETVARFIQSHSKGSDMQHLAPFLVDQIELFSARPGGGGPYLTEAIFKLGRAARAGA